MLQQMGTQLLAARRPAPACLRREGPALSTPCSGSGRPRAWHGTIKNRMAVLRWWATHIGKPDLLPPRQHRLRHPPAAARGNFSKARELPMDVLAQVRNRYVRMSLELQRAFGCDARKVSNSSRGRPITATGLCLHPAWCKGGHGRSMQCRRRSNARCWSAPRRWCG